MPEYRLLTTLVPRVAAGTLLVLLVGTFTTNNAIGTGSFNKPIYLGVLALGIIVTAAFLYNHRSTRFDTGIALLAAGGLTWGMWTIERPQLLTSYWEGFGYRVAIASLVLVVLFGTILQPRHFTKRVRIGLGVIVCVCCLCDVLGLVRTVDYMPYVNNNLNEINDMLGPVAGKAPDSTFIPAYTALYGWVFVPLKHQLSPLEMVGAMSIFLTLLDLATVGLAAWIVKGLVGSTSKFLLPIALVVPITYVTSHLAGDASSIGGLFQELPIRLFSGFLIAAVGLKDLALVFRGYVRTRHLLLIGALCGIVTWNSQDFGLSATAVYGVMVVVCATGSHRWRAVGVWLAGLAMGVLSYPLFLFAVGSPLNLGLVGTFVKEFGSGFYTAAIQVPGPVLIVMPIIVCSATAGWALMRIRHRDGAHSDERLDRATITLTFMGTWAALSLVYYINRAYAAGQLQTMLLPCGVCIAALLSIAIHTDEFRALWATRKGRTSWSRLSDKLKALPVGLFVCLCFASALLTPNPIIAAKNLLDPPPMSGFTTYDLPEVLSAVGIAQKYTSGKSGDLTYLGESFNFVSLETKVPSNAILFAFPYDASSSVTQLECQYVRKNPSRWMVLSLDGVTAFGTGVCGIYHSVNVRGVTYGQIQELK